MRIDMLGIKHEHINDASRSTVHQKHTARQLKTAQYYHVLWLAQDMLRKGKFDAAAECAWAICKLEKARFITLCIACMASQFGLTLKAP